jgi:hypothetical protein
MTRIKPLFQEELSVQTNDKLIIEGPSNLVMKPKETTRELLNGVTKNNGHYQEETQRNN